MRRFWHGWLEWAAAAGIDYFVGRTIPPWLDGLWLRDVAGEANTAWFHGASDWARYWTSTIEELAPALLRSTYVTEEMLDGFRKHSRDRHYWTSVISFTASWGWKPAGPLPVKSPRLIIPR